MPRSPEETARVCRGGARAGRPLIPSTWCRAEDCSSRRKARKATKALNAGREEVKAPVFAVEGSRGPQDQRVQLARCGIHAQGTRTRPAEADRE